MRGQDCQSCCGPLQVPMQSSLSIDSERLTNERLNTADGTDGHLN